MGFYPTFRMGFYPTFRMGFYPTFRMGFIRLIGWVFIRLFTKEKHIMYKLTAIAFALTVSYQAHSWETSQIGTVNNTLSNKNYTSAYSASNGNGMSGSYGKSEAYGRVSGSLRPTSHGLSANTSISVVNHSSAGNRSTGNSWGGGQAWSYSTGRVNVEGHVRPNPDIRVSLNSNSFNESLVDVKSNQDGNALSFTSSNQRFYGGVYFNRFGDTKVLKSQSLTSTFTATDNGYAQAFGENREHSKIDASKRVFIRRGQ